MAHYSTSDYGAGYQETADSRLTARDRDLASMHRAAMARREEMLAYRPPSRAEIIVSQPYDHAYQVIGGPRFTSASAVRRYAERIGAEIVWSC